MGCYNRPCVSQDRKPLPKIRRGVWSRVSAGGRIAARLGATSAAGLLGNGSAARARLGDALVAELDQLKGMAMKVGQILSYMDTGLPTEVTDRLAALQAGVRPVPGAQMRALVTERLGRPVDAIFSAFDDDAVAAASIGQVHRAQTLNAEAVAVKVRYPGIEETIQGDFAVLSRLASIAGAFTAVDGKALVAELRARIVEECDYRAEARWQQRFAEIFAHSADIAVPRVHADLCADGVLTSAWHTGATFEWFCAHGDPQAKQRAAMALFELAFFPLLTQAVLHADPHPGNQLYQANGQIVALDFGCVRAFDDTFMTAYRGLLRAMLRDDRARFQPCVEALGLAPNPKRIDWEAMWTMLCWQHEPLRSANFTFTRAWWERGRQFSRPTAPNARHQGVPPAWIWVLRTQFGLWALLTRLQASGEFATPFGRWLDEGSI